MRIRSIKPEFWRSDDIASLTLADRLLFIGLWSYVDDSGVGVDKVSHICADLFAPDLERDPQEVYGRVTGGLRELSSRGLISRYTVDGKHYLNITTWNEHQRIEKPSKARYSLPTCENATLRDHDGNTPVALPEMSVPGAGEQGNRGTGEQEKDSATADESVTPDGATKPKPKTDPPGFTEFWTAYPRKVGKDDARRVWTRRTRDTAPDVIAAGARRLAADPNLPDVQFIPHPSTWLSRGGWTDDPYPAPQPATRSTTDERVAQARSFLPLARALDAANSGNGTAIPVLERRPQ